MDKYLTPKGFLQLGGVILLVLGIIGFVFGWVFPEGKFLTAFGIGDALYLDNFENMAHTLLGIVALAAAYALPADLQKWLVAVVGAFGIFVTIIGFLAAGNPAPNLGVTNLEILDNVIHLVVGAWGLYAAFRPVAAMQTA